MTYQVSQNDRGQVVQSMRHARLIEASRKLARIVKHTDPSPTVKEQRTRLEKSLTKWIRHHGGPAFASPFSPDHLRVLAKILTAINRGGLFAMAMPRGHGKSTILKWVTLYVLLTGRRCYVSMIAATADLAQSLVEFVRQQITENDTLHAHYPHVTTYARATDGKAIKARYQLRADGKSSGIQWSKTTLVLPEVVDSKGNPYPSNGAILEGHGLTGAIRGKWRDTKTGKVIRPDFAILDDPQTRESAESVTQCQMRERIITGDVLGLAGPRKRIAAIMPCTIIQKGDLADRFLDHSKHPEWQGETCKLVNKWPKVQETLWKRYAEIYREQTSGGKGFSKATQFYAGHRAEMDEGSECSWESRVRDGEISALQTAENLLLECGRQFWAEYQNDPQAEVESAYTLTADIVASRVNGNSRREMPESATITVGFVDINLYALSWGIAGSSNQRAIYISDYGLFPGHGEPIWTEESHEKEAVAISNALTGIDAFFRSMTILRGEKRIEFDRILLDCGARWMQAVFDWLESVGKASTVPWFASRGWPNKSYNPGRSRIGRAGEQWHKARWPGKGKVYVHNADYWRAQAQTGFLLPPGTAGSVSLFGKEKDFHLEYGRQVASEHLLRHTEGEIKDTYIWSEPDFRNDFLDVTTGLLVAASIEGAKPDEANPTPRKDDAPTDPTGTRSTSEPRQPAGAPAKVQVFRPSAGGSPRRQLPGRGKGGGFAHRW